MEEFQLPTKEALRSFQNLYIRKHSGNDSVLATFELIVFSAQTLQPNMYQSALSIIASYYPVFKENTSDHWWFEMAIKWLSSAMVQLAETDPDKQHTLKDCYILLQNIRKKEDNLYLSKMLGSMQENMFQGVLSTIRAHFLK